jgi:antitoxin ParD1/3/4
MSTINIPLPDSLKADVDLTVSQAGYATSIEYARELTSPDTDRCQLRAMMLSGLESPFTGPADAAYFQTLRKRAARRKNP